MKLSTLEIFVQVMEQHSFSKAAVSAYTTQSNISKQMEKLEDYIGAVLFIRGNRGIEPTPAARYLFEGLKAQLPGLHALLKETREVAAPEHLRLTLGVSDSMSSNHISPLLTRFRLEHPSVEFKLEALPRDRILRQLADGQLDVALIYSVWPTDAACVVRYALTRTPPCLYYSKILWPDVVDVESFRDATFVRLPGSSCLSEELPYPPRQVITLDNMRTMQFYVASGMGCAILGRSQLLLDSPNIAALPLYGSKKQVGTDVVWLNGNNNFALELFRKCVERHVLAGHRNASAALNTC